MATMEYANGAPNYSNRDAGSNAASSRFIPEIWSTKLLTKFYETTVLSAISNTDYEGEIKSHGDKVLIRTVPDITINDYDRNQDLVYEFPESPSVELRIDQGKYFAFTADDVDAYQSDIALLDKWSTDASEQMKIAVDRDVLGSIYADVDADNTGANAGKLSQGINLGAPAAPVGLTKDNIIDYIVDLGTVLDEQDVPETDRWLILPSWANGMVKKSDLKDASLAGDNTSIVRNGRIGMIDRFTVYRSNLLAASSETVGSATVNASHILAGHKSGLTFASQMTNMETLRNPKKFGDLVRGLNIYGFEVVNGKSLAHLYAVKG